MSPQYNVRVSSSYHCFSIQRLVLWSQRDKSLPTINSFQLEILPDRQQIENTGIAAFLVSSHDQITQHSKQHRRQFTKTSNQMLKLADKKPLFIGGTRYCYVYPGDPEKCIKVLRPDRTGIARKRIMSGWKKYRPEQYFDDQIKEITAYDNLTKKSNPRLWEHIPEYFGTEETDMGIGIITKLFRNADGSYPDNLQTMLPKGKSRELADGISEFGRWLLQETVVTRDLLPHNIIAVTRPDGSQQVVIVDGIGNSEFIPMATWFKFAGKIKIRRKLKKFQHRIEILLPGQEQ